MIDIGVNFAGRTYNREKIRGLLEVFKRSGGESIISISNSVREIGANQRLAEYSIPTPSNPNGFACPVYYTAGCHPHGAKDMKLADYDKIRACLSTPNNAVFTGRAVGTKSYCVAVGEMGLDYNRMFSPKEVQMDVFRRQVRIAKEYNCPMYLHVRDAFDDFINIIREEEYSFGVVHCFTGTLQQAEMLINYGFKLGITGWLLDARRNADLLQVVGSSTVPLECLMVETDAPYMSMAKLKKQRLKEESNSNSNSSLSLSSSSSSSSSASASVITNTDPVNPKTKSKISHESEPADIVYVIEEIARLKNIPLDQCTASILSTTKELFRL